jgi:hypothetical protein
MYLYGESTLDEILFPILQFKNQICSNTLDGRRGDYTIKKSQDIMYSANAEDIEQSPVKEEAATSSTHHDDYKKQIESDSDVDE